MIQRTKTNGIATEDMKKKVSLEDARVGKSTLAIMKEQKVGNVPIWKIVTSIYAKCVSDGLCIVKRLAQT